VRRPADRGRCPRVTRRGREAATPAAMLVAMLVGAWGPVACTQPPSSPTAVFSLSVDSIPSPSVVAGDTMRDSTGVVAPLRGQAYNVSGHPLAAVTVRFITLTPRQLTIDGANHAIGAAGGDSVARVVADAQGLQSLPFTVPVVLRPDSIVHADTDSTTSLALSLTHADSNVSVPLTIQLRHIPTVPGGDSLTRTYRMQFRITYPVSAAGTGTFRDTTLFAYLVDANGNPARADTTDASGQAARRVRFQVGRVAPGTVDSVVVEASALYRVTPVPGSPVRFVIHYSSPHV